MLMAIRTSQSTSPTDSPASRMTSEHSPDLVCRLSNVQLYVDSLTSLPWKEDQASIVRLNQSGVFITVKESTSIRGTLHWPRQLFTQYDYRSTKTTLSFVVSSGLFARCLSTFLITEIPITVELKYSRRDRKLLLKSVNFSGGDISVEIRPKIPVTYLWDKKIKVANDFSFTVKLDTLKEVVDDLKWSGTSTIQLILQPFPPCVTFKAQGRNGLQIDLTHLKDSCLTEFLCDRPIAHRYNYKFLKAATLNMCSSGSDHVCTFSLSSDGLLRIDHTVHDGMVSGAALIWFFVHPENIMAP